MFIDVPSVQIKSTFINTEDMSIDTHIWLLDYWNRLRGDRFAPTWQEIALHKFPGPILPFVNVTDITTEPLSSVYRFWGTGLTTAIGGDYTGRSPIEVPPKAVGLSARGGCGRMVNERLPHCEVKQFQTLNGYRGRAVVLRVPCTSGGEEVTQGLSLYKFEHINPEASLSAFFDEVFGPLGEI